MQSKSKSKSTFRPTRAPFGFSRLQMIVLGLAVGLLALSIAGYVARHDTASTSTRQSVVTSSRPAVRYRFTEANVWLPNASRAVANNAHMLEINQLPNTTPAVAANTHLLEINALPGDAAPSVPMLAARTRFLEINQLPGDGSSTVTSRGLFVNRQ
jgi:hypothetical protein